MPEENKETDVKHKKSIFIFNINTILASIAIVISILSYFEAVKTTSLTEESIRPQITLSDFKAYYDEKNVEFEFTLINKGKSTAVIEDFMFTTLSLDDNNKKTYHNLKNRIMYPNKEINGTRVDKRFLKIDNANFKVDQIDVKPKEFSFTYKYYIHGKSNIKFQESSTDADVDWIQKSNKSSYNTNIAI